VGVKGSEESGRAFVLEDEYLVYVEGAGRNPGG